MANLKVRVDSPRVRYSEDFIEAEYEYRTTRVAEVEADENDRDTYTVRILSSIHPSIQMSRITNARAGRRLILAGRYSGSARSTYALSSNNQKNS